MTGVDNKATEFFLFSNAIQRQPECSRAGVVRTIDIPGTITPTVWHTAVLCLSTLQSWERQVVDPIPDIAHRTREPVSLSPIQILSSINKGHWWPWQ